MMDVQLLEPGVLLVPLPAEPQLTPELALVRQKFAAGHDLILDFSRVEMITSPSIGGLLLLQRAVLQQGGRLIVCSVRLVTRCILRTAGLDMCFESAEDRSKALMRLHRSREPRTDASHFVR